MWPRRIRISIEEWWFKTLTSEGLVIRGALDRNEQNELVEWIVYFFPTPLHALKGFQDHSDIASGSITWGI